MTEKCKKCKKLERLNENGICFDCFSMEEEKIKLEELRKRNIKLPSFEFEGIPRKVMRKGKINRIILTIPIREYKKGRIILDKKYKFSYQEVFSNGNKG